MNANDELDITAVMSEATKLWIAHEMDRWGEYFTDDADFVAHSGLWWASRRDNVDGHKDVPDAVVAQKRNYTQRLQSIAEVADGVALVHTRWHWPNHVAPGAQAHDRAGIITYVLVKRDGRWLIRAAQNTRIR
ncbi:SgcJ/EcaC family oxidoreductase [Mycobacterium sp. 21AC1]|uniref:SgcJ/EcaC family oxidoreductase n=1 Tax=[Mycobacterium] appelbergii TaxID=2939269 RepID=UPI002939316D|nr:SgcJ/EcaC family oxidoreductase [Mycobacterium sp. 21AC1]MDV3126713.1 SgcJ/EcaC family oxidoreductase [Mycobacterium sp. 21AC1]